MRSAVYYPHTEIKSEHLLKTSLLLWDQLEFIVPWDGFTPHYEDKRFSEAVEVFGVNRALTDADKKEVHQRVEEFATQQLPSAFYYQLDRSAPWIYEIYPQKLMHDTWELLQQVQLAGSPLGNADYPLSEPAALSIMSILADCRAGDTRARVTDRSEAYANLTNLMVDESPDNRDEFDRLVPMTLKMVDLSKITLDKLISLRKKELKSSGHDIRDLRHRYVDRLAAHAKALATAKMPSDREELDRQFLADMKDDLAHLKEELRMATKDVLFSKDVVITGVAAISGAAALSLGFHFDIPSALTAAGAPVTVGGFLSTKNKFAASRKAILQKHPMAYLHTLR